jgi:hypothetical protein
MIVLGLRDVSRFFKNGKKSVFFALALKFHYLGDVSSLISLWVSSLSGLPLSNHSIAVLK